MNFNHHHGIPRRPTHIKTASELDTGMTKLRYKFQGMLFDWLLTHSAGDSAFFDFCGHLLRATRIGFHIGLAHAWHAHTSCSHYVIIHDSSHNSHYMHSIIGSTVTYILKKILALYL